MKVAKMLCTLFIAGGLGSFVFARTQQIDDSAASSNSDEQQAHASGEMANIDYRLLATNKTSTMDKEMNEAADAGYRFQGVMGGETSFGGSEVVVVMSRAAEAPAESRYQYRLLATSKTSTMQKELQEAADAGFAYQGQTVFKTSFGGQEVVVILEKDLDEESSHYTYKLLATKKTSTMQKELREAGSEGYEFVGFTVSESRFGGSGADRHSPAGASSVVSVENVG